MAEFKKFRNKRSRSFDRPSNRNSSRSSGRGRSENKRDLPLCDAVCSKCGEYCKLPFKPTSNKPVFCSSCYGNNNESSSKSNDKNLNNNFELINNKLDKILKLLENKNYVNKRR